MSDRSTRKQKFIDTLAEWLTRDLATRSILLRMGKREAQDWAELYGLSGCHGYATKEEAVATLTELLG
jgi:hypothetical protein